MRGVEGEKMLQYLHVKNLALIEETEVDFGDGLNILSGETGAGKSIIIGSINLALGEKVPKELLRNQGENSLVELVFHVDEETEEKLKQFDVYAEDHQVIMTRKIVRGHSSAKINSETVTSSKLKEVSSVLIDIHGQHEHQSLIQKKKHLELLDKYALEDLGVVKEKYQKHFQTYKQLMAELEKTDLDEEQRLREISFLEYEINEIADAELRVGEDLDLEESYKRLSHGKKIEDATRAALQYTEGQNENASDLISRAYRELSQVTSYDSRLEELFQQLGELESLLGDFNRELSHYVSDSEYGEEEFFKVEKRLDLLNHLKSKYGASIEQILAQKEEKEEKLERMQELSSYRDHLKVDLKKEEQELEKLAKKLTRLRKKASEELCKKVTQALIDLNFLDVQFEMEFVPLEHFAINGRDDVQFMISVNPGEPLRPLNKIASGGEMSRIMLALKAVLADKDEIETLIFDEIDAGISGRTAQAVSEKLHVIAKNHQIICITHLPQIAAMADTHFLIQKSVKDDATISTIRELEEEESIEELARMLGGVKITDRVLDSAREMKDLAKHTK